MFFSLSVLNLEDHLGLVISPQDHLSRNNNHQQYQIHQHARQSLGNHQRRAGQYRLIAYLSCHKELSYSILKDGNVS